MKLILSIFILASLAISANSQISVDNVPNANFCVQNVLLGSGVSASNITFSGDANQIGTFDATGTTFPISTGVIMASGDVEGAIGPNNSGSFNLGGGNLGTGDPDLDQLEGTGSGTNDATVLEFDFVPAGDTARFKYIFGSDEYPEFVNAGFNDAFGFFLSGPGITGPYSSPAGFPNGAANIALIPGTTTPVTIDNVNGGLNASFYVDNETVPGQEVQYDGYTVVLEAVAAVQCGETYHIKIAIADVGDDIYDSGVFLEANSFNSSGLSISANVSQIYEGCPGAYYVITRPDTTDNDVVPLVIQGSAVNGSDYGFLPDSVIFDQGALTDTIWLDIFSTDGDTNFCDTLEIFINDSSACGGPIMKIIQTEPLEVSINPGDTICTQQPFNESHYLFPTISGGVPGPYSFGWNTAPNFNFPGTGQTDSTTFIQPDTTTYITLTVIDGCGNIQTSDGEFVAVMCPLTAPNVFTPNGDGLNDYFFIVNLGQYPDSRLEVYNRWGRLVYENDHYLNDWDGGDLSDGVYYYILYPNGHSRPQEPFAGTVYITGKTN